MNRVLLLIPLMMLLLVFDKAAVASTPGYQKVEDAVYSEANVGRVDYSVDAFQVKAYTFINGGDDDPLGRFYERQSGNSQSVNSLKIESKDFVTGYKDKPAWAS